MSRSHPVTTSGDPPAENIALVPACLLPYRARWQGLANALPTGCVLVSLPPRRDTSDGRWDDIVRSIQAMGHRVLLIPMERFLPAADQQGADNTLDTPSGTPG